MTKQQAKSFKNFGFNEKSIFGTKIFENYEQIDYNFVRWLDNMVTFAKQEYGKKAQFIIHDFNLLKHSEHSYHYAIDGHLCIAVDGHFAGLTPYESYMIISKYGAKGIGYYPDWVHPGFHIDMRPDVVTVEWTAFYLRDNNGNIIYQDGQPIQKYNYDFKHFIEAIKE